MTTETPIVIVPNVNVSMHDDIVYASSSDKHACEAFMAANGLERNRMHPHGYTSDTRAGTIHYGRIPHLYAAWTAFIWPRDVDRSKLASVDAGTWHDWPVP